MRKIIASALSAIALLITINLQAQTPPAAPSTMLPYTTIKAYITVQKEVIFTGPYARYAQKYLGVIAPLADRKVYTIISANLDYTDPERSIEPLMRFKPVEETVMSHVSGGSGFTRATLDRISNTDKSTEEMARDAANVIFSIRRQRLDIITSDAGELYAGGLQAAFDEMSRIENEYLSLFLGKQSVTIEIAEIDVTPQADKTNYIVCRFANATGILPDSDLSGEPVILTITPERAVVAVAPNKSDKRQMIQYRVADFTECKLSHSSRELVKKRMPVYQFGINMIAPAK